MEKMECNISLVERGKIHSAAGDLVRLAIDNTLVGRITHSVVEREVLTDAGIADEIGTEFMAVVRNGRRIVELSPNLMDW